MFRAFERLEERRLLSSISGMTFEDLDADGIWEAGDAPLPTWRAYADLNRDGAWQDGEPFATAGPGGFYSLELDAGSYIIRAEIQQPYVQSYPAQGYHEVALPAGMVQMHVNFGVYRTGSVIGTVSVKDSGARLAGRRVFADVNEDGTWQDGEPSSTTDAQGSYRLDLMPGVYQIRAEAPQGWATDLPGEGAYAVTIRSGTLIAWKDFTQYQSDGVVAGKVYADSNQNGVEDASSRMWFPAPVRQGSASPGSTGRVPPACRSVRWSWARTRSCWGGTSR